MNADDCLAIRRNFKKRLPAILAGEEEGQETVCFNDDGAMRTWDRPPKNGIVHMPARWSLTSESILKAVCETVGVKPEAILGPRKGRKLSACRHIAMVLLAEARPDLSLPKIGKIMKRDHTTVIYALKMKPKWRQDPEWFAVENKARKRLGLRRLSTNNKAIPKHEKAAPDTETQWNRLMEGKSFANIR